MTPAERKTLIAKYKAGYDEVVRALAGIGPEERDWRPAPGEWSAREVVHHLADSETISGRPAPAAPDRGQPGHPGLRRGRVRPALPLPGAPVGARPPRVRGGPVHHGPASRVHDGGATGAAPARIRRAGRTRPTKWLRVYADHGDVHAEQIRKNRAGWAARNRSRAPEERVPPAGEAGSAPARGTPAPSPDRPGSAPRPRRGSCGASRLPVPLCLLPPRRRPECSPRS